MTKIGDWVCWIKQMPADLKRSLTIAGHRTSLSLEPEFWQAFQQLAEARGRSIASLAGEIDRSRGSRNLSSAIRVWVLEQIAPPLRGERQ